MSSIINNLGASQAVEDNNAKSVNPSSNYFSNGGMDGMDQINELMIKLADMCKKIRNLSQEYNIKQKELGWDTQLAYIETKTDAINKACEAAKISAGVGIVAGMIGMATGGSANPMTQQLTQQFTHGVESLGKMAAATVSKQADLDNMTGAFQLTNSQSYLDGVKALADKIKELSREMQALITQIVALHDKLGSAVHN